MEDRSRPCRIEGGFSILNIGLGFLKSLSTPEVTKELCCSTVSCRTLRASASSGTVVDVGRQFLQRRTTREMRVHIGRLGIPSFADHGVGIEDRQDRPAAIQLVRISVMRHRGSDEVVAPIDSFQNRLPVWFTMMTSCQFATVSPVARTRWKIGLSVSMTS